MNLKSLTDQELDQSFQTSALREREALTEVLNHIVEVERRKLDLKMNRSAEQNGTCKPITFILSGTGEIMISTTFSVYAVLTIGKGTESNQAFGPRTESRSAINRLQVFNRAFFSEQ